MLLNEQRMRSLIEDLQSTDWTTSSLAAEALFQVGEPAVSPLLAVVADVEMASEARRRAIYALSKIAAPRSVDILLRALSDKDGLVGFSAAMALGELGDQRAVAPLMRALEEVDYPLEPAIRNALVRIGVPAVLPLIAMLAHPSPRVRRSIVMALGYLADKRAVQPLLTTLQDLDAGIASNRVWEMEAG